MERKNNWKKVVPVPLLVLMAMLLHAQVTINAMVPGAGVYLKPQLWNLSVTNTGAAGVNAQVRLQLRDLATHETILSAVSATFPVPHGSKLLQEQVLQPIQYTYGTGAVDRSPTGMLPVGQYQACYQLYLSVQERFEPAADDCFQLQVEPLSPPLLAMPEDGDTVAMATPAFTWVPPAPLAMFGSLNYDFLLTEVYPGQSTTDAVQKNLPVQQATLLGRPFLPYPMQSPQLDTGKLYAWQVTARDGDRFAARSEVWTFRMKGGRGDGPMKDTVYLLVDDRLTGTHTINPGILHIKYPSAISEHEVLFTISDGNGQTLTTQKKRARQGDNYLDFPLGAGFGQGHGYTLTVQDIRSGNHLLTFYIK